MAQKQAPPRPPRGLVTQTLILSKKTFKTLAAASKWIRDHGFKVRHEGKPPDETSTSFRFRQRDPGAFQAGTFRTIQVREGVSMVVGRLKTTKAIAGVCTKSIRMEAGQAIAAEMNRLGHEIAMQSGDPCVCDECQHKTAADVLDLLP